jgi:hypothetical protein
LAEARKHLNGAVQFESQASSDAIVKRAVDRSREMLARIDASTAPVAQAAPQATIAGGQFFNGPQSAPVQQTARAVQPQPTAPSSASATADSKPTAPTYVPVKPTTNAKPTATPPTWNGPSTTTALPTSKPVRPTQPATSASVPAAAEPSAGQATPTSSGEAAGSGFPFSLPQGFNPQN